MIWGTRFRSLAGTVIPSKKKIGFLKLKLPAGVFSQANPSMAREIYEAAVAMADLKGRENGTGSILRCWAPFLLYCSQCCLCLGCR